MAAAASDIHGEALEHLVGAKPRHGGHDARLHPVVQACRGRRSGRRSCESSRRRRSGSGPVPAAARAPRGCRPPRPAQEPAHGVVRRLVADPPHRRLVRIARQVAEQHWPPRRVGRQVVLLGTQHGGQRADLGLAQAVGEADPRQRLAQLLQHRHRHDRCPGERLAQRTEIPGGELRMGGQGDPQRRRGAKKLSMRCCSMRRSTSAGSGASSSTLVAPSIRDGRASTCS